MSKLTLTTEGDTHVVVTRRFAAPPQAVYRAHTEPDLIQKWLLGPEGWTMPVCISEARPGGKIRYEWTNDKGGAFHLTGEYSGIGARSQDCACGADVPAGSHPRQPRGNEIRCRWRRALDDDTHDLTGCANTSSHAGDRYGARNGSELSAAGGDDLSWLED